MESKVVVKKQAGLGPQDGLYTLAYPGKKSEAETIWHFRKDNQTVCGIHRPEGTSIRTDCEYVTAKTLKAGEPMCQKGCQKAWEAFKLTIKEERKAAKKVEAPEVEAPVAEVA